MNGTRGNIRVDQSIITAGIYTQTLARNSNDPINVDNSLNIRPNAPGVSATNVSVSGSVFVSQSIQVGEAVRLSQSNPLPSGTTGSLAVSGSNLYFFDGTWRQISLV